MKDITGIELTPGNYGQDCMGNGEHYDEKGNIIECCCDECNYLKCCFDRDYLRDCLECNDMNCSENKNRTNVSEL